MNQTWDNNRLASIKIKDGMLVLDFSHHSVDNRYENIEYFVNNNLLEIKAEKQVWMSNTNWNDNGMYFPPVDVTKIHPSMLPLIKTEAKRTTTGFLWWKKEFVEEYTYINSFWVRLDFNLPQTFTSTNYTIIQ